jgi:hypothetical protein
MHDQKISIFTQKTIRSIYNCLINNGSISTVDTTTLKISIHYQIFPSSAQNLLTNFWSLTWAIEKKLSPNQTNQIIWPLPKIFNCPMDHGLIFSIDLVIEMF